MQHPRIAVVGGGVTGLVAAGGLARQGAEVTVLEAGARLGGQVHTVRFRGLPVDVGAEALHTAAPRVLSLVDELGLTDRLLHARSATAWLWLARGLRPLPAGVGPAGPTRLGPVLRARVLSPLGLARAALEPLVARPPGDADTGVGTFVAEHFGAQVRDRLVDPLLGALHAGDTSRLSLQAATPQLAAMAARHRSLLLAHRARRAGGGAPGFVSFPDGLATLVERLTDEVAERGDVRCSTPVVAVEPAPGGYRLLLATGEELVVEGVVLALPAHVAAGLLQPLAPGAAEALGALRAATVATVVAAYPRDAADGNTVLQANGLLVPASADRLLKAATFLTSKWPHLAAGDSFLVRLSAGRAGSPVVDELSDDQLVAGLHADLVEATGLRAEPLAVHVERWPRAIAQLEVGHLARLGAIRAQLPPAVALAGAPYEGIGIASCVTSGARAAATILDALEPEGARP